jgi:hypothetical protein
VVRSAAKKEMKGDFQFLSAATKRQNTLCTVTTPPCAARRALCRPQIHLPTRHLLADGDLETKVPLALRP